MRVVAWNIRAGGARSAGIVDRLSSLGADVAVVAGVRGDGEAAKLRGFLDAAGYEHQVSTEPPPRGAGLLVASRRPVRTGDVDGAPIPASWLHVEGLPFELGAVYGPIPDDPTAVGASPRWWAWLTETLSTWRDRPALVCGDLRGASPEGDVGQHPGAGPVAGLLAGGWWDVVQGGRAAPSGGRCRTGAAQGRDHAFATPSLRTAVAVSRASAGGLSEHNPVLLDVAC